jgi:hypothetical protein
LLFVVFEKNLLKNEHFRKNGSNSAKSHPFGTGFFTPQMVSLGLSNELSHARNDRQINKIQLFLMCQKILPHPVFKEAKVVSILPTTKPTGEMFLHARLTLYKKKA